MKRHLIESKQLLRLAVPVFIAQVAQTSMGFVDTVMAGGVSPTDMAAVAVASSVWLPTLLFGLGILMALVPVISQLYGRSKTEDIPFQLQQGIYLALILSIPLMLVLDNAALIVSKMEIEEALSAKSIDYLRTIKWAMPGVLLFTVFKGYCEGLSKTTPAMVIGFIGLAANVPLNWIFVYGKFGMPQLDAVGCAVATVMVYWLMAFALMTYIRLVPSLNKFKPFGEFHKPNLASLTRFFRLGLPVALSMFFEITLFACVAMFLAPLGSTIVASHQIAVNFSSLVFMLPLSIGIAVSIRVSHQIGAGNLDAAKVASHTAIMVGLVFASITATTSILMREKIAMVYNTDPVVVGLAGQLMLLAAIYQLSDATQVIAAGALRGYKDMNAIFVRTFISYWIVGMPTGYILGRTNLVVDAMGPHGFWIGNIIGLTVAAILLGQRLLWIQHSDRAAHLDKLSHR
uniref:MATE family efflux transporter n=1 Tax=Thaumasiovibrio occultus TaxID=1891184 RepID=UPI000B34EBE1|nr:MATE family efflux transporter [Thaumasiovibrio occultus]